MDAYEKIKCSRKAGRPTSKDYIDAIFTNFTELHGDRRFGDDHAILGGVAWLRDMPVTVIGIEKGHSLNERMYRNFGCVLPEGYRKALRLMKEAEKFRRPVVCFVDTQGASCGHDAEKRGEGQSIAENLYELMTLKTPIVTVMAGEGGSSGALALAIADRVWMLENAYYSVISPESCASILFKDPSRVSEAAENLHLFADDLKELGIVEKVVAEAAEFTPEQTKKMTEGMAAELYPTLKKLLKKSPAKLTADRYEKYRKIGRYEEIGIKNV